MPIYKLGDKTPKIHPTAWIADNAVIIGYVEIGPNASVWFNVVVRADNDKIIIGENTNIQDSSVLHADPGFPLIIGKNVTVGHMVMLHGCTIKDGCLVGIRSTVLNGTVVEENSLVGAGALIAENKHFGPGSVLMGIPARVIRTMDEKQAEGLEHVSAHYVWNSRRFMNKLQPIDIKDCIIETKE